MIERVKLISRDSDTPRFVVNNKHIAYSYEQLENIIKDIWYVFDITYERDGNFNTNNCIERLHFGKTLEFDLNNLKENISIQVKDFNNMIDREWREEL